MSSPVPGPTWHVQTYFPRLSAETTTSRFEWCCLVCLSGGCSQLQGLGDSWTHGSRRRRPKETWITLMEGLQRPGEPPGGFDLFFYFFKKKELLADPGGQKPDSPSPTTHFLKASSTISPDPGLESHRRQSTAVHESFQGGGGVFPGFPGTGCTHSAAVSTQASCLVLHTQPRPLALAHTSQLG